MLTSNTNITKLSNEQSYTIKSVCVVVGGGDGVRALTTSELIFIFFLKTEQYQYDLFG